MYVVIILVLRQATNAKNRPFFVANIFSFAYLLIESISRRRVLTHQMLLVDCNCIISVVYVHPGNWDGRFWCNIPGNPFLVSSHACWRPFDVRSRCHLASLVIYVSYFMIYRKSCVTKRINGWLILNGVSSMRKPAGDRSSWIFDVVRCVIRRFGATLRLSAHRTEYVAHSYTNTHTDTHKPVRTHVFPTDLIKKKL